jgi:hypothetical protein
MDAVQGACRDINMMVRSETTLAGDFHVGHFVGRFIGHSFVAQLGSCATQNPFPPPSAIG